MHIEPEVVTGAKIVLSYGSAAGAIGYAGKQAIDFVKQEGVTPLLARSAIATAMVFCSFEVLPHHPVGVSEVHIILGTTLYLLFGLAPAAFGLILGLLAQGLFFAPFDLPQYGMNVTTLLVPLFAMALLAKKIIPAGKAYVDLQYREVLPLSVAYQGGICVWVAFWALYGGGFGAENLTAVGSFFAAYMLVVVIEPFIDLGVLALAKAGRGFLRSPWVYSRLHHGAA